jgi:hypothetical protein
LDVLFPAVRPDQVGFDAMPDAAGGEGVTGPLNRKG